MSDGWQSGWMRRVLAALLALALLAVPGTPMRHAAAAPAGASSHHSQGRPCLEAEPAAAQAHAAGATHHAPALADDAGQDRPCSGPDAPPGLSCCAVGPCAGLQGAPPPLAGLPVLPVALARGGTVPCGHRGRDIRPALKPPRAA